MTRTPDVAPEAETVTLGDGRRVTLRRPQPEDRQGVGLFFDALAGDSLEARRIATVHAGTARLRKHLVEPTPERGTVLAVSAGAGASVVGLATGGRVVDDTRVEGGLVRVEFAVV